MNEISKREAKKFAKPVKEVDMNHHYEMVQKRAYFF